MFLHSKKSFKGRFLSQSVWRDLFLIADNPIYKSKEKLIISKNSVVPTTYTGLSIRIYRGNKFFKRNVNRWMIGYKFGEFIWTRRLALYKAKQSKKKKSNEIWTSFEDLLNKRIFL